MGVGSQGRKGFTLVEVLTVIAIIGVLAGILIVAVIPMLNKGPDLQDANDILQLQISVNNFKAKYGVYPPSKIRLRANAKDYLAAPLGTNPAPDALDAESLAYIGQIWPRFVNQNSPFWTGATPYTWDGGLLDNAGNVLPKAQQRPWKQKQSVVLDGDQCLVFFLGGPTICTPGWPGPPSPLPTLIGTVGFSTNPEDPCGAGKDRISFYQLQASRLTDRTFPQAAPGPYTIFPSYYNNWAQTKQFYVYFSSGKRKNGYNSGGNVSHEILPLDGVAPYYDVFTGPDAKGNYNITSYLNPASFQIVSAGLDGRFTESGKPYPLSSPKLSPQRCNWNNAVSTDPTLFWKDNRANFTSNQLQVP